MTHQEIVNRRLALYAQIEEGKKAVFDAKRPELEQNVADCAALGHVYDDVPALERLQMEQEFSGRRRCMVCHGFDPARGATVVTTPRF